MKRPGNEYTMEKKVLRWIREEGLIAPGDDVTVAFSGGADSVALLRCLHILTPELKITLRAAHYHHGLRGAEADRDAEFCRRLCAQWGIPFRLGRGDAAGEAARTGRSIENAARTLRYAFLEQTAPGLIATAHNADDNAETLLLHLLRGTGPRGLGGIPPRRGRILRPLLSCTRAEILTFLEREGLSHVEDSTNLTDDCLRNRLRHRVLPLLRQENPNLAGTLGRTVALVRAEDEYLSRLAAEARRDCRREGGYSCAALLALDPVLRRRILTAALWELGLENPSLVYVEALEALLTAPPSARLQLPEGHTACRVYDLLCFDPAPAVPEPWETELILPGETPLPGGLGTIRASVTKSLNFSQKNLTTFALKYDMISTLDRRVRSRRSGDRLRLSGGSKPLKALMIDRKIPAARRGSLPVLTADGSVVAVFGLGADPAWTACPGEKALVLELLQSPFPEG